MKRKYKARKDVKAVNVVEWMWAGYLPPSRGANGRRIDQVRKYPRLAMRAKLHNAKD